MRLDLLLELQSLRAAAAPMLFCPQRPPIIEARKRECYLLELMTQESGEVARGGTKGGTIQIHSHYLRWYYCLLPLTSIDPPEIS